MNALNTFFNGRTARNTGATAWGIGQLASADRLRELQQRGWIKPSSTPGEVGAVEAILAAQMRARIELQSGRLWPYRKVAFFGGIAAGLLVLGTIGSAIDEKAKPGAALLQLVLLVLVAAISGVAVLVIRRREDRRNEVLARAVVRDDVCGWCREPGTAHARR